MISYTELRTLPRVDLASAVPLPRPFTVHIEPTSLCNMRCSFCPVALPDYSEQSGGYEHMPMEMYTKILYDLRELGHLRALKLYFLGEPFLNPELVTMIRAAKQADVADRLEITTNGTILPLDIIGSGLDYLRISVYTPKRTRITRNIEALMAERKRRGRARPHISVKFMPEREGDREWFETVYCDVADELTTTGFHNWASTPGLTHLQETPRTKHNCPFVHYMLVIKANGEVVPCCADWNARLTLGNVRDQSLTDIWNGRARRLLVERHIRHQRSDINACRNCDLPETTPDNMDGLTIEEYRARMEAR